jgi:hypothetical protein
MRKRELDVGPEWAGSKALREFNACAEALDKLGAARRARGGGSVNALTWNGLRAALRGGAEGAMAARLAIEEHTLVAHAAWDGAQWELRLAPSPSAPADTTPSATAAAAWPAPAAAAAAAPEAPCGEGDADADALHASPAGATCADGSAALVADVVWVACGGEADAGRDRVLSYLRATSAPARVLGGLPVLEPGLRWPGAPVFLLGACDCCAAARCAWHVNSHTHVFLSDDKALASSLHAVRAQARTRRCRWAPPRACRPGSARARRRPSPPSPLPPPPSRRASSRTMQLRARCRWTCCTTMMTWQTRTRRCRAMRSKAAPPPQRRRRCRAAR